MPILQRCARGGEGEVKTYLIDFYKPKERKKLATERIVVKDYEEARRYAKAMRRVHKWTIRDIKEKKVREAICHTIER